MVTLGIIGGRDVEDRSVYSNQGYVDNQMNLISSMFGQDEITIVSGGSRGSEVMVENWASRYSIDCRRIPPRIRHFEAHVGGDDLAFRERNNRIISASDTLVFFWDGMLPVIKDAIQSCATYKKPAIIFPMI